MVWRIMLTLSGLALGGVLYMYAPKRLNSEGYEIIKQHEGLRLDAYQDVAGYWTIGYGHLIQPDENYQSITIEMATALLIEDVARFEKAVNKNVKVPLTQNMFNALVSFAFNVGVAAFEKSTLLQKLNKGDYIGANEELKRWVYAGGEVYSGLEKRREQEQRLFWS